MDSRFLTFFVVILAYAYGQNTCPVDVQSIDVQPNFDLTRYAGVWYITTMNRMWMSLPGPLAYIRPTNLVVRYDYLPETHQLEAHSSGKFPYMFCMGGSGVATPDVVDPGRMSVHYRMFFSRSSHPKPYWILDTDYTGYAVVYSCRATLPDGSCDPEQVYINTLNRQSNGHTEAQQDAIDATVARVCLQPADLFPIVHSGSCVP